MRKTDELKTPTSCFNKAGNKELLFVLRGHDICAPLAIRAWIEARILTGKNNIDDPQIKEAMQCASQMEIENEH